MLEGRNLHWIFEDSQEREVFSESINHALKEWMDDILYLESDSSVAFVVSVFSSKSR